MAQRLPVTGSDNNTWGDILNGFLGVSLNGDGTVKTNVPLSQPDIDFIDDTNGSKEIELVATASTANWIRLTNSTQGNGVTLGVNGTGSNENLTLAALGTGTVQVGGSQVTTAANTQTLSYKTISGSNNNTFSAIPESAITNLTSDLASKQPTVTLTTTGTSGAATFSSNTLNIPNYAVNSLTQASSQTANFTAAAGNLYPVSASSGAITVTLPTSSGTQMMIVKKTDSSANAVTLSGTINGTSSATYNITKQNQSKELFADGGGGWTLAAGDLDLTTLNATTTAPGFVQLAGDLAGAATSPALVTTGVTAGTYGSSSTIPSVTVDAKGRVTSASAQTPYALQNYSTTNTGTSYQGQWTKIATQTVAVQYQDTQVDLLLQAYNDGELTGSLAQLRLRTKQQNAFGNNPYVDAAIVNSTGIVTTSNLIAVITQNTPSTSVDFYLQVTEYNRIYNISILSTAQIGSAATQILANQSFVSSVPAGVAQQIAKYDQVNPASSTLTGGVRLTGDLGGTAAAPTTPTAVHLAGTETITGNKTFTGTTTVATPVNSTDAATKSYVDSATASTNPKSFSSLAAWYKPDTGVTSSGGYVSAWADQSSSGNNLAQSTSSAQPTFGAATANGLSLLGFDGSARYINGSTYAGLTGNAFTVVAYFKPTSLSSTGTIFVVGPSTGGFQYRIAGSKQDVTKSNTTDLGTGSTTLSANTAYVGAVTYDGTNLQFYLNGTTDGSSIAAGVTFTTNSSGIVVGAHASTTTEFFNGYIGEIAAYGRALSSTEIMSVSQYFGNRYSVSTTTQSSTYVSQTQLSSYAVNPNNIGIPIIGTNGITVTETSTQIAIGYSGSTGSGIARTVTQVSAATTAAATSSTDYVYWWTGSTAYTLTMPTAASNTNLYTLKNSSSVSQTVATTSSQTIDGGTTITITASNSVDLISNGTNWMVI